MCNNKKGFKLCTCGNIEQATAGWILKRKQVEETVIGDPARIAWHREERMTINWLEDQLNTFNCFDFDYQPTNEDELLIRKASGIDEFYHFSYSEYNSLWSEMNFHSVGTKEICKKGMIGVDALKTNLPEQREGELILQYGAEGGGTNVYITTEGKIIVKSSSGGMLEEYEDPVIVSKTTYMLWSSYWSEFRRHNKRWFTLYPVFIHDDYKSQIKETLDALNVLDVDSEYIKKWYKLIESTNS